MKSSFPRESCSRRSTIQTQRSEEHTSELQSRLHLVCRLLLEKKKCSSPIRQPFIAYLPDNSEAAQRRSVCGGISRPCGRLVWSHPPRSCFGSDLCVRADSAS